MLGSVLVLMLPLLVSLTPNYTLSLHDALPIFHRQAAELRFLPGDLPALDVDARERGIARDQQCAGGRSEEHTSELQSHSDLVCRLLLEKKSFLCWYG